MPIVRGEAGDESREACVRIDRAGARPVNEPREARVLQRATA